MSNRIFRNGQNVRTEPFILGDEYAQSPDVREYQVQPSDQVSAEGETSPSDQSEPQSRPDSVSPEEAEAEAEKILASARKEAAEIRERAQQEGFDQGIAAAQEKADRAAEDALLQQTEEFRKEAQAALREIQDTRQKILDQYLRELMEIAVNVAEKVVHVSLSSSGEVMKRMISAEVEKRRKTAWMKIYIDRKDYDLMVEADADVAEELSRVSDNIKFVVMDHQKPGTCIIETPEEITDISVDTQMNNIRSRLGSVSFEDADV